MNRWLLTKNKGLIIGFIFGAFFAPLLASLGLISSFFEILRPLLIGPMDLIGKLIPDIQTVPNTYYVPAYKWFIVLGFNGICYALFGAVIQTIISRKK